MTRMKYQEVMEKESWLRDDMIKFISYVLRYTVTNAKDGGRGSYFRYCVTESIPKRIQQRLSDSFLTLVTIVEEAEKNNEGPNAEMILRELFDENEAFCVESFERHCVRSTTGSHFNLKKVPDIEEQTSHCFESIVDKVLSVNVDGTTANTNIFNPCWSVSHFESVPKDDDGNPVLESAWTNTTDGFVMTGNTALRLKRLINFFIKPQSYTIFFLLSAYEALGIEGHHENDIGDTVPSVLPGHTNTCGFITDKVNLLLELFFLQCSDILTYINL